MLSTAGDGNKLSPLIILKGELGKKVETNLRNLSYVKNNNIYIYGQNIAWCNKFILANRLKTILELFSTSNFCLINGFLNLMREI